MNRQEMFDRAVRGLASQGWQRAVNGDGSCQYLTPDGRRCAWGWVDPEGTQYEHRMVTVRKLRHDGIGLAATLTFDDEMFARSLQRTHDTSRSPEVMREAFQLFAKKHELTWPEGL